MKIRYECEKCKQQFDDKTMCTLHELAHISDYAEKAKHFILRHTTDNICKYCEHVYYVYGCEESCSITDCCPANGFQCFTPLKILRPDAHEFHPEDYKGVDVHK